MNTASVLSGLPLMIGVYGTLQNIREMGIRVSIEGRKDVVKLTERQYMSGCPMAFVGRLMTS